MFWVGKLEQLDSTEIQALEAKEAKEDLVSPGELHMLPLVLNLTISKGGAKWIPISLYRQLCGKDHPAAFDCESACKSYRSAVSALCSLSQTIMRY